MAKFVRLNDARIGGMVGYVNMDLVQAFFRAPDESTTKLYEVGNDTPAFLAVETPEEILAMMGVDRAVFLADMRRVVMEILEENIGECIGENGNRCAPMIPALVAEIMQRVVSLAS